MQYHRLVYTAASLGLAMLSERLQSQLVRHLNHRYLSLAPTAEDRLPAPRSGQPYLLYMHIPFCERLCPYCSFNRYLFAPDRAAVYFADLRREMQMLADLGYDFQSLYIGGGTPTVWPEELFATIDAARQLFSIREVSCETNPNHLTPQIIQGLQGRVQRLSCGVQSFDDGLLQQMQRYDKYGSGLEILERLQAVRDSFETLNIDMIFNFPSQTEEILIHDLAAVLESGASQVTFYPLMASRAVAASLAASVGRVDYRREQQYYQTICAALTEGPQPEFDFSSAWTFNRRSVSAAAASVSAAGNPAVADRATFANPKNDGQSKQPAMASSALIDEYIVSYEEYPAIGAGGLSYLDGSLYVNTFSLREYHELVQSGRMSLRGKTRFSRADRMRYRFMMQLFGLRLDKLAWQRDFGCSVASGVPAEYLFFKTIGAIATEDIQEIRLSAKGRYLLVALMREFFIGVNGVRDQARAALPAAERELLFGE